MGTHRLTIQDKYNFHRWVNSLGYMNEYEFWQALSGLSRGSVVDHMVKYLSSLGYSGSPNTQFLRFLKDQVGLVNGQEGTIYDMANELFHNAGQIGNFLQTSDGEILQTSDGESLEIS